MFYEVCSSRNVINSCEHSNVVGYRSTFERAKEMKSNLERGNSDRFYYIVPRNRVD